jgi:hypothetical protein
LKIYPDRDNVCGFVVHLTAQELENVRQGLQAAPHPDSPWSLGTVEQIEAALRDNREYQRRTW